MTLISREQADMDEAVERYWEGRYRSEAEAARRSRDEATRLRKVVVYAIECLERETKNSAVAQYLRNEIREPRIKSSKDIARETLIALADTLDKHQPSIEQLVVGQEFNKHFFEGIKFAAAIARETAEES